MFCSFSDWILFCGYLYTFLISLRCQKLSGGYKSAAELHGLGRRWLSPYFRVQNKKKSYNAIDGVPAPRKAWIISDVTVKISWDLVLKREMNSLKWNKHCFRSEIRDMLIYQSMQFSVCNLSQFHDIWKVMQSIGAGINCRKQTGKDFKRKERKMCVCNLAGQQRRPDCAFYLRAVNTELGQKCFMVLPRTT